MKRVHCSHFYGTSGDPGIRGGGATPHDATTPDKAIAWAVDRIVRPVFDDRHPGRVLIQLREGRGHGVSVDVWVSPRATGHGARVDVLEPRAWGYAGSSSA